MKNLLIVPLCLACSFALSQSNSLSGTVQDESSGEIIPGATILVENSFSSALTDHEGKFELKNLKPRNYRLTFSHISYEKIMVDAVVPSAMALDIKMKRKIYLSDEVTIAATRATTHSAVAYTHIDKDELEKNNLGQDIPYLLNLTPSVVVTSDAGTGVGYTGIRIRGSDATRVNVTLNGVPVNDAEAHGVYWVDLPDLASSVDNIQIQRGAGTSTNGVGAFGASINIQTSRLSLVPFAAISSSYGSFNTWKNTVSFGTGLLKNDSVSSAGFAFDGRFSKINSDGYIDRATSDLKSVYLSGGYYSSKSSLRFIILSGKEKTYQAWYGVPEDSLQISRTFNPAGMYLDENGNILYYDNQTDNYQQDYYQLLYSKQLRNNWDLNLTAFLTKGRGYYEEYKMANDPNGEGLFSFYGLPNVDTIVGTNLVRRKWLDNNFTGVIWSANKIEKRWQLILGGALNNYNGEHFNEIIWGQILPATIRTTPFVYVNSTSPENNDGRKTDGSIYSKFLYDINQRAHLFADLQVRSISYQFVGWVNDTEQRQLQLDWSFFNPKAGITFDFDNKNAVYAFVARAGKEPVRNDLVYYKPQNRGKSEYMTDIEAGYKLKMNKVSTGINFYYMSYKDQLVLTGAINDVGEPLRKNVAASYRRGVEVEAAFILSQKLNANLNATFSENKTENHTEFVFDYDLFSYSQTEFGTTNISFSPPIIAGSVINYSPVNNFMISLQSKYVGKQFLDNTSNENKAMDAYFVNDFRIGWKIHSKGLKELSLTLLVNNIFDVEYVSNGYTFSYIYGGETISEDYYYPQAGRNFLAGITMKF